MADDNEMTVEQISELSVDKAKEQLGSLTIEQLRALRAIETNDGDDEGRVTMVAAIDAELAKREPTAADPFSAPTAPAALTGDTGSQAASAAPNPAAANDGIDWKARALAAEGQLDAIGQALGNDAFTQDNGFRVDTPIHDRLAVLVGNRLGLLTAAQGEAQTLRDKIVAMEQQRALGEAPIGTPLADHTHVAVTAAPASMALLLMEGGDAAAGMLPIPVSAEQFQQRSADTVVYQRAIDLFPTGPAFTLTAVQLVMGSVADGGFDVVQVIDTCPVMPALTAGGGRSVQLPAGTLMFRQPAKSAAEDAAARAARAA